MIVLSPIQSIAISPERSYDEGMNDLKTLLNHLPYKLAAYDAQGNFLYDNGVADGSFNEGKVLGFWETIYDLKQPLKTYLDNSAQALVAWSDATSGASFKEETDF